MADWEASKRISTAKLFREAGTDFGMFTVGRDEASQVYYHTDFFREKAGHAFEVVSRTEEAYLYQTAYVLRRKGPPTG